jgi:predicted ATP-dependent serine protease
MSEHKTPMLPDSHENYLLNDITPGTISWKERQIDLTKEYPEPIFLLEFNGVKFFTKGDVIVIKGKPKKGKSHLMIAYIVALLSGEYIGMSRLNKVTKLLYVDCEMQANYTALLTRKIHKAVGIDPKQNSSELYVLNLKADTPTERERIIEEAIQELNPDIVFIDGVKDITRTEPNDQAEGKRIGEELKQWSAKYDCMIAIAIHENKNDSNARGAVGAAVEEICSEVWRIDRNNEGLFTASQTLFRYHSPVENLCFTMDEQGTIQVAEAPPKISTEEKKLQSMKLIFSEIFTNHKHLSFTGLQTEYMRIKQVKNTAAYNALAWSVDNKVIVKNLAGDYELSNLLQ